LVFGLLENFTKSNKGKRNGRRTKTNIKIFDIKMNRLFKAAWAKAIAEQEEAMATLDIYFNKAVGIGEHPDLLTEVNKYVDMLANSRDKIQALEFYEKENNKE
tara:strand:+ start:339 stop:647 length:309 start_codon:yes stop_codon:yes gene_type:complete